MRDLIIFLDVDGVLNKSSQWKNMFSLDDACIENFCKYVKSLNMENIKIILTSTWKNGWDNAGNHAPHIIDLQNRLNKYSMKEKIAQTKIRMDAVKARMGKEKSTGYYKADILLAARIYKVSASKFNLNSSSGSSRTPVEAISDAIAGDKHTLPIIFHSTDIKLEKNWNLMSEWDRAEEAYHEMWKDI